MKRTFQTCLRSTSAALIGLIRVLISWDTGSGVTGIMIGPFVTGVMP